MNKKIKFEIKINNEILNPKGFYYQGKFIIIVGCVNNNHTIRRKELISEIKEINLSYE
tara:strand:- start:8 stop:181 length:174 start_codon:yes stop_codon:yes gene_type:complete